MGPTWARPAMIIRKLGSATVLIEHKGTRILCDPWLTDGVYYGSWHNYPPVDASTYDLTNLDYIYISHIHPDHFDAKTMELLDPRTPVLIHTFQKKFLKANIERLGFSVIELENGTPFKAGADLELQIFAADNCNPQLCGRMFGCVTGDENGSMQIDSLCVFKTENHVVVNTNDCSFAIAEEALRVVKKQNPNVDLALVGYTSASLFPHCMLDFDDDQMAAGIEWAKHVGLSNGLEIVKVLAPKFFMPFAGTYILGGSLHELNDNLPLPELEEAAAFIAQADTGGFNKTKPVLLNYNETFNVSTGHQSKPYQPASPSERDDYIKKIASRSVYEFSQDPVPTNAEIVSLMNTARIRLRRKQVETNLVDHTNIIFDLPEGGYAMLSLDQDNIQLIDRYNELENYMRFKIDGRLLKRVLMGPKYANWNNLEIGAHLGFARKPDVYRPEVHVLINAFHV